MQRPSSRWLLASLLMDLVLSSTITSQAQSPPGKEPAATQPPTPAQSPAPPLAPSKRFYHNMWVKKLPKLAALREAQLWMLAEGPNDGVPRGLSREGQPAATKTRLSPYYWAPFVLSGDWR